MSSLESGNSKPVKKKDYLCEECGKVSKTYSQHYEHKQRHSKEKRYKCLYCFKAFHTCGGLNKHKRTHATERRHFCKVCKKGFTTASNAKIHQITVHEKKQIGSDPASCDFACGICGKKFPHQYSVKRHVRRYHSKQRQNGKKFICPTCSKGFVDKNGLKIHSRIHNNEKPFVCSVCGKKFTQVNNLKDHLNTHSSQRPYSCDICGRGFNQKSNLNTHKKRNNCSFGNNKVNATPIAAAQSTLLQN